MNSEYKDFIGVFSHVYDEGFCEHMIAEFERLKSFGAGSDRKQSEKADQHVKDDYHIFANCKNITFDRFNGEQSIGMFFDGLQKCFDAYTEKYSVLKESRLRCSSMKLQRTGAGGGYHVWHGEQGNNENANRGLVYMLYLNTLPAESYGETEFLYQQRRVTPTENTVLIWPAAYTHAHRGNPVYGDTYKYIITGWFCYE